MRSPPPQLAGDRVLVNLATERDVPALLAFHQRNRDHLKPWSPPAPDGFLTPGYWRRWTAAVRPLYDQDQAVRLLVRWQAEEDGTVLGQISLSNIQRGPFQSCLLGYHLDAAAQGQGLMHEALQQVIGFAFGTFGLHRLAANYMPNNRRSGRLLERLGFEIEGYAKAYLFVDGAWRDHVLTALTDREAPPPSADLVDPVRPAPRLALRRRLVL